MQEINNKITKELFEIITASDQVIPPDRKLTIASAVIDQYFRVFPNTDEKILREKLSEHFNFQSPVSGINYDGTQVASALPGTPASIQLWKHQYDTVIAAMRGFFMGGNGCILGDAVGAGKTYQLLSIFSLLKELNAVGRLVLIVPSNVIPDWELALKKYNFSSFIIEKHKKIGEWYQLKQHPPVVIIPSNIRESHEKTSFKLQKQWSQLFSSNDSLYAGDEEEDAQSESWLHKLWKSSKGFKAILSGTIITTTLNDIIPHLNECAEQLPGFLSIMRDEIAPAFYKDGSFLLTAHPYLPLLEVWSNLQRYLHVRLPSQLGINSIPDSKLTYVEFPQPETDIPSSLNNINLSVPSYKLLTVTGVSGESLREDNQRVYNQKNQENLENKISYLLDIISSHQANNNKNEFFSVLLVFSNKNNIQSFKQAFQSSTEPRINQCQLIIIPNNENFLSQANKAMNENKNSKKVLCFLTTKNFAEGFNIQNFGLEIVVFINACRQASKVLQAIGRAVRPREKSNEVGTVQVFQFAPLGYGDHVKNRFDMATKGTALLALLSQSPTLVMLLIALDTLNAQPSQEINGQLVAIITAIKSRLAAIEENILALKVEEENFWKKATSPDSVLLKYPFIFQSNHPGLSAGNPGLKSHLDNIYRYLFSTDPTNIRSRFLSEISSRTLYELLTPSCVKLAYQFKLIPTLLNVIDKKLLEKSRELNEPEKSLDKNEKVKFITAVNNLYDLVSNPSIHLIMQIENNIKLLNVLISKIPLIFLKFPFYLIIDFLTTNSRYTNILFDYLVKNSKLYEDLISIISNEEKIKTLKTRRVNLISKLANLFFQLQEGLLPKSNTEEEKRLIKAKFRESAKSYAELIRETSQHPIPNEITIYCAALNYLASSDWFDKKEINASVLVAYQNLVKTHSVQASEILPYLVEYTKTLSESDDSYPPSIQLCFQVSILDLSQKNTKLDPKSLFTEESFSLLCKALTKLGINNKLINDASRKISNTTKMITTPPKKKRKIDKSTEEIPLFSEELVNEICGLITQLTNLSTTASTSANTKEETITICKKLTNFIPAQLIKAFLGPHKNAQQTKTPSALQWASFFNPSGMNSTKAKYEPTGTDGKMEIAYSPSKNS